jgi:hypothetical protein
MMAPIRWTDIFRLLRDQALADLDNIRWVLPMAVLLGYLIVMTFSCIDMTMATRERESGRYRGLDAISYVEDSAYENAVGEIQRSRNGSASISVSAVDRGKLARGYAKE